MIADFGQQQWSCINFRLSDRTLRSRDRIWEFSQELVKICAVANNLTSAYILACRAGTTSRYSTGETSPIKAGQAELYLHLGSTCQRGNTSTRIWTRALQPVQEEVSSWKFRRAQIVSGPPTFSADISLVVEISTSAKILLSAYISARLQHFVNPPIIEYPPIFGRRQHFVIRQYFGRRQYFANSQYFHETPIFSWDANILGIRQYFHEMPIFYISENNLWICLIFVAANIYIYFQYFLMLLSVRQYFWRNCFGLKFKIDIVVMIIWSIVFIINFVFTL